MSFNRLMYDECEGNKRIRESIGPGYYNTNTPVLCGNTFQMNPQIQPNHTGASMNSGVDWRFYAGPVDVESDLRNLSRPASRCPDGKYVPKCAGCTCKDQGAPCGSGGVDGCAVHGMKMRKEYQRCGDNNLVDFPDSYLHVEETRMSNPPMNLRGVGWNRFEPLCFNPQDQIEFPGMANVDTRLTVKDNHRACIPYPNMDTGLPKGGDLPAFKTGATTAAFTGPLSLHGIAG